MTTLPTTTAPPPGAGLGTLDERAHAAEVVRSFLVELRGGAPFLSAADGSLLLAWLDRGVPVSVILASLEHVHRKRVARGTRGRLTLQACRREVDRRFQGWIPGLGHCIAPKPAPTSVTPRVDAQAETEIVAWPGLLRWSRRLRQALHASDGGPLAARLEALAREAGLAAEDVALQAIAACREHQARAWARADQAALRAEAEQELRELGLGAEALSTAVDALAMDRFRSREPLVSVAAVWDSLRLDTESP